MLRSLIGHVWITPYDNRLGSVNATTSAGPEVLDAMRQGDMLGPGAGFVHIRFTPAMFIPSNVSVRAYPGLHPVSPAEVLFHELVHAIDMMWGSLNSGDVGPTADEVTSLAEARATQVANMFHSERHRPLRGPYQHSDWLETSGSRYRGLGLHGLVYNAGFIGFRGLHPVPTNPASAYHLAVAQFNHNLAVWLNDDIPSLAQPLAAVPRVICEYNPFSDQQNMTYGRVWIPERWLPPTDGSLFDPHIG